MVGARAAVSESNIPAVPLKRAAEAARRQAYTYLDYRLDPAGYP